jgi:hypothetical protein
MAIWKTAWRYWPWMAAAAWGGGAIAVLTLAWLTDGDRSSGGLLAAASNGLLLFFLVGGLGVADDVRTSGDPTARSVVDRAWSFALVPAALTVLALLPLRIAAIVFDVPGPWSSVGESTLDILARSAVVYLVVAFVNARGR